MIKTPFYLFLIFLLYTLDSKAQNKYNFYISNSGSDTNQGVNETLAKQTIAGSATALRNFAKRNGIVKLGLQSGNVFNESLAPDYSLEVGVYDNSTGINDFAIMNGSEPFDTGWTLTTGLNNTYQQEIKYTKFAGFGINGIGNYSYIYVTEIDKQLEQSSPYTARKVLQLAPSVAAADTIPGSFFEPVMPLGAANNVVKVYIHTSNSGSPNKSKQYRYEITVRDKAVDGYIYDNNRFENLWVRGYGAGYGLLPGGAYSYYNKIIFGPGAAIHHAVIKSGTLSNCLFLPTGKNISGGAIIFYNVEGFGRHNKISNSLFLDLDNAVYAHTSGGTNHGAVELSNVTSFGNFTQAGILVSTANTDSLLMSNIYCEKLQAGYNNGSAKFVTIENTVFKDVTTSIYFSSTPTVALVKNVFIRSDKPISSTGIIMGSNTILEITNSIIHLINNASTSNTDRSGTFISASGSASNHINSNGNIFISQVDSHKAVVAATVNTNAGIGTSSDTWNNNVYILLSGNNMYWTVSNHATNANNPTINSFSEWQRQSGQDQNSLFFDLRKDPRGLKAIFIDPDNGNYELANTVEGNKVRALKAGMTTPLHCFLKKPTYEEAAEMIRTEKVMKVDDCRNPCQQAKVRVIPFAQPGQDGMVTICQGDELALEGMGVYTENNTYYHQSDAKARYLWWFSDGKDTSGNYLHRVTHRFTDGQPTDVRLQLVDPNGCDFDTTITVRVLPQPVNPDLGNDTLLCTGQTLLLKAGKSAAGDRYIWSTGDTAKTTLPITKEGEYWLRDENSNGCTITDTINVINKTPVGVSLGNDTLYCASAPNLLTPVTTGAVKTYQWSTGATTDTFRIPGAGTYILTSKDSGVCLARDTIVIADNPVNTFSLPGDTLICEGTAYSLILHPPAATTIRWNDDVQGYYHVLKGGAYSIAAENGGCVRKDTMLVNIQPLPVVRLIPDTLICSGYALPLSAFYAGADYRWSTGSRDSSIFVTAKGTYWVQATINGCNFRDSINVAVQNCECEIEIPNAFSPNGDGINDVLRPKMKCFPLNYNLSIFNRYGQVIFNTRNYNLAWDGTVNGKPLPVGTYYYVLTFDNEGFPNSRPFTGSITLLR